MSDRDTGQPAVGKMALFADGRALVPPPRLDQNPAVVYLARLAKGSRRVQLQALNTIARLVQPGGTITTLQWEMLRYQHTQAIRARLVELYAPATANRMLAALRGTLKECWRLELTSRDAAERAADLAPVAGTRLLAGRYVTGDELCSLMEVCMNMTARGARDAALIAILSRAGLRREEAAALHRADLDDDGTLVIRHGKGDKARTVTLGPSALVVVETWLAIRGDGAGPLLNPVLSCGTIVHRRLTGQGIADALSRRAVQAGIRPFTPHDLRRTFASDLLESEDISTVKHLLGHAKVETTTRYDRRGEEVKRRATAKLELFK